jgi:hypothetical protein
MPLIDRDCVRRLIDAPDADAALVLVQGECVVVSGADADGHGGLLIAHREDLAPLFPAGEIDDRQLDLLVNRLDTTARNLGG